MTFYEVPSSAPTRIGSRSVESANPFTDVNNLCVTSGIYDVNPTLDFSHNADSSRLQVEHQSLSPLHFQWTGELYWYSRDQPRRVESSFGLEREL